MIPTIHSLYTKHKLISNYALHVMSSPLGKCRQSASSKPIRATERGFEFLKKRKHICWKTIKVGWPFGDLHNDGCGDVGAYDDGKGVSHQGGVLGRWRKCCLIRTWAPWDIITITISFIVIITVTIIILIILTIPV